MEKGDHKWQWVLNPGQAVLRCAKCNEVGETRFDGNAWGGSVPIGGCKGRAKTGPLQEDVTP